MMPLEYKKDLSEGGGLHQEVGELPSSRLCDTIVLLLSGQQVAFPNWELSRFQELLAGVSQGVLDYNNIFFMCEWHLCVHAFGTERAAYPCIILQDEWRDVDLLRFDAGEELWQVVQVTNLVLHPWHAKGGEEPCWNLERTSEKWSNSSK